MTSFERPNLMLRRGQASRSPISPKKRTRANLLVLSSLSVYAIFSALTVCQFNCWNFCTSVLGRSSRLSLSAAAGVSFVYKKALHGSPSLKLYIPGLDTDFDHSFEDKRAVAQFSTIRHMFAKVVDHVLASCAHTWSMCSCTRSIPTVP